jgi:hypothetical protein
MADSSSIGCNFFVMHNSRIGIIAMKLSEQLQQDHDCGDFGKALAGYAERAAKLEIALDNAMRFALWVECIGRTDCEVYKHELKGNADLAIERITKGLEA